MIVGVMRTHYKINLVFLAFLLMILQINIKIINLARLDEYQEFEEEFHFLGFAKEPLLLVLLQTHFDYKHKRPIQFGLGSICLLSYVYSEMTMGYTLIESMQSCGTRISYVLGTFICLGYFFDSVVSQMFKQIAQTEEAHQEVNMILDNLEESIVIIN